MTYTVHNPQVFFSAIVTRIATATGKQTKLGVAPDNPVYPYVVIYPLVDENQEGALNDPSQMVTWAWQVTCVSNNASGAQWMQAAVRQALHGHIPTVTGFSTTPIHLAQGSGVIRDNPLDPPLFYTTDRFTCLTGGN